MAPVGPMKPHFDLGTHFRVPSCQCVSIRVYPCLSVSIRVYFLAVSIFLCRFSQSCLSSCLSVSIRVYPCLFLHMRLIPIKKPASLPCEKLEKIDATSPWRDCITLEQNLTKNRRAPKVPQVFLGGAQGAPWARASPVGPPWVKVKVKVKVMY